MPYSLSDRPGGISRERCISDLTSVTALPDLFLCPTSVNCSEERCPQLIRSLCIARSSVLKISAFFPRLSLNSFIDAFLRPNRPLTPKQHFSRFYVSGVTRPSHPSQVRCA